MSEIPVQTDCIGPYGVAQHIPYEIKKPEHQAHLVSYLITAPHYHPIWFQYILSVVDLKPREGVPDAKLQFEGATHEMFVITLNPSKKQTVSSMLEYADKGRVPYLFPVNIADQFEATDEEMERLAWLCSRGVVNGFLTPEVGDAPDRLRENWLAACVKTLAHIRGEEHSSN